MSFFRSFWVVYLCLTIQEDNVEGDLYGRVWCSGIFISKKVNSHYSEITLCIFELPIVDLEAPMTHYRNLSDLWTETVSDRKNLLYI